MVTTDDVTGAASEHHLTGEELVRRVLDLSPANAVFDCDGTLWSADAGKGFMDWSLETGLVDERAAANILARYERYKSGELSEEIICGDMTRMYRGLPIATLRAAAGEFFDAHIAPTMFPVMRELLEELRSRGVVLWAVSSTNAWVIEHGVAELGIPAERVLAARVCVNGSLATGELLTVPTGAAKATALTLAGLPQPDCVFGNSIHDAAMLAAARAAFAINPSPALLELAQSEGWPVYLPLDGA